MAINSINVQNGVTHCASVKDFWQSEFYSQSWTLNFCAEQRNWISHSPFLSRPLHLISIFFDQMPVKMFSLFQSISQGCMLWYPSIQDTSTWSKFGAHGEHGYVFLFSNLGALWFSEDLIRYSLHICLREVKNNLFPSKTVIYGISRDDSKKN